MRATRLSEIREWNRSLIRLRDEQTCQSPGFFKPYHFVTMALMLKEQGAGYVNLPIEITSYAARMRLWEAIGLESPVTIEERPSGSRFHELTRLSDLAAVGDVSAALSKMVTENVGKPCSAETQESLFITLTELLGNCHHHARTTDNLHGLVCAQTWYKGARAQFAIADSGIGIRRSLGENPDLAKRLATQNACTLATQLGISSKLNRGHAGYGLAVARDLALQTPGAQLFVQSLDEAVMVSDGQLTEIAKFEHAIPGTLVVFEWDMKKPLDIASVYASWPKAEDDDDDFF